MKWAVVLATLVTTATLHAQAVLGEYLVTYKPGYTPSVPAAPINPRRNVTLQELTPTERWRLARNPAVLRIEPNYRIHLFQTNDPFFSSESHLNLIHAPNAWAFTHGSPDVRVAVLDTGVDITHPELSSKVLLRQSFVGDSGNDAIGHGTFVCGIIGAGTNNGIGIASVGYDTSLIVAKITDIRGNSTDAIVIQAIDWAVANGAKVISMSFGHSEFSQTLKDAIDDAWNQGVVLVAAAGNTAGTAKMYPAAFDNCIAVGATDGNDRRAGFSTYGSWVRLAAPGVNILSLTPGNHYTHMNGTSFAAPMVSAAAALLWSNGARSNYGIRQALLTSGEPTTGFGSFPTLRLDIRRALLRFP